MGAGLMVETADWLPPKIGASSWRALMVFARLADDTTRRATVSDLIGGGAREMLGAESDSAATKRFFGVADRGLLLRVIPDDRSAPSCAFALPRFADGEHLKRIDVMDEPTAVYRLHNADGQLIYVGISGNPKLRLEQHARTKPWWPEVVRATYRWHGTRTEALARETRVIHAERPPYNLTDQPTPRPVRRRF